MLANTLYPETRKLGSGSPPSPFLHIRIRIFDFKFRKLALIRNLLKILCGTLCSNEKGRPSDN